MEDNMTFSKKFLLISAIFGAFVLCLFLADLLSGRNFVSDPNVCFTHYVDIFGGFTIIIFLFIIIAYLFRNINKFVLAKILIPSAILCLCLYYVMLYADDSISGRDFNTKHCHILPDKQDLHGSIQEYEEKEKQ